MKKYTFPFLAMIISLLTVFLSMSASAAKTVVEFDTSKPGMTFDRYSLYTAKNIMNEVPVTYEAWIKMPTNYSGDGGVIYGNSGNGKVPCVRIRVTQSGYVQLYYYGSKGSNAALTVLFDNFKVNTGKWLHIAIVDDIANKQVLAYLNGELKETSPMSDVLYKYRRSVNGREMCIGGDYCTGQELCFKGEILSVAVFKDVRTADEIKADMKSIDLSTDGLISCYDLSNNQGNTYINDLRGKYTLENNRTNDKWVSAEGILPPENFAYSIALLGDTQIMSGYYPEDFHYIMDWLLENKDSHKIQHVLNMGDMTNFNTDKEWNLVREEYFRLNGNIDYTLVRGDHDTNDDKVANNGDDTKKYDRFFGVDEYLDRLKQPDSDYYKGADGSITNSYRAIDICGNKYLIVTLDKNPTQKVLNWTKEAIKKYPEHRVIITTHCYLEENGNPGTDAAITGNKLFSFYKDCKNIEFIISGHMYAYGICWTKQQGTNGNVINQILVNPQGPYFDANGATGMIAMLYFSADGKDVEVRFYSSVNDSYFVANDNPMTGNYAINTSCFKMKTDTMDTAIPVKLESSVQKNEQNVQQDPTPTDESTADTSGIQNGNNDQKKNNNFIIILFSAITGAVIIGATCIYAVMRTKKANKPK